MAPEKLEGVLKPLSVLAFITDDGALGACSGDDEPQPSCSAALFTPSNDDGAAPSLRTAASLPLLGEHAPGCLDNMVTGLSSPCFHTTLASPHKLNPHPAHTQPAPSSSSAATTAAATAAFALSMAAACDTHRTIQPPHTGSPPAEAESPRCVPRQQAPGCSGLSDAAAHLVSCASPVAALPAAAPAPSFATKRGLYEGTVRGGSVRNTWIYLTTRNPAG